MQKLTQLERLDLGSNEFTEVVSFSPYACLPLGAQGFFLPYQGDLISFSTLYLSSLFYFVIEVLFFFVFFF